MDAEAAAICYAPAVRGQGRIEDLPEKDVPIRKFRMLLPEMGAVPQSHTRS